MQRSKKRKLKRPVGNCYELAAKLVLDTNEGTLVHGRVWSVLLNTMIDHAWVEIPPGTTVEDAYDDKETIDVWAVIDLTLKWELRFVPRYYYYPVAKAEVVVKYSPEEVRRLVIARETWGPWHE